MGQFRQNAFHLSHEVVLILKRYLEPHRWMDDISRPAEVRHNRYRTHRESFKDHSSTEFTNRWEYQHIRGPQSLDSFGMSEHSAECNLPLDSKGRRELLKALALGAVADHGKVDQVVSQQRSGSAQSEITSLIGN